MICGGQPMTLSMFHHFQTNHFTNPGGMGCWILACEENPNEEPGIGRTPQPAPPPATLPHTWYNLQLITLYFWTSERCKYLRSEWCCSMRAIRRRHLLEIKASPWHYAFLRSSSKVQRGFLSSKYECANIHAKTSSDCYTKPWKPWRTPVLLFA